MAQNNKINIDALDGFRALAIISVILYHLDFDWACGGLLGVTMFFVLSGYLITGLLAKEINSSNKINLKNFWIRRAKRLLPAVLSVIIVVAFICVIINHLLLTKMKPDIVPSIFFIQNWWYVFRDMSYFESLGEPSPLIHFWSLAIEEQFYLIWPLVLIGGYKIGANNKAIRRICLALAIVSAIEMALMFNPLEDPTRVYYGTDTRAFSLLIGSWLSFVFPWYDLDKSKKLINKVKAKTFDIFAGIALIILVIFIVNIDGTSSLMYRGILFLTSILTAVVLVALVLPEGRLASVFASKPLVWTGKRSYGIYLWHFPIILILKDLFGTSSDQWWFAILVFVITFVICNFQYKFIEEPIRNGDMLNKIKAVKDKKLKLSKKGKIAVAICVIVIAVTAVGIIVTPDETYVPEEAIESTGEDENHAVIVQQIYNPILIGDSVPAAINLAGMYPGSLNDSVISRWTFQAVNVLQEYANQGALGDIVIMACFSNQDMENDDLENMYNIVGPDRHLFLVNSCTPYDTSKNNNAKILEFCKTHDDVELIDWYGAAMNNPDLYFYNDKIHLNLQGKILFSQLIAESINPYLPAENAFNIELAPTLYPDG